VIFLINPLSFKLISLIILKIKLSIDAKDAGSKGRLDAGRLMRSIFSTIQSLEYLPDRIYMRIRLFYYEDGNYYICL